MRISAVRAPTYIRVRLEKREGREQRRGERERGTGRCITLTPRVVTCKCGVKTDVNIRTNGGVAGVRNGERAGV